MKDGKEDDKERKGGRKGGRAGVVLVPPKISTSS
jgi:hypothetical protein